MSEKEAELFRAIDESHELIEKLRKQADGYIARIADLESQLTEVRGQVAALRGHIIEEALCGYPGNCAGCKETYKGLPPDGCLHDIKQLLDDTAPAARAVIAKAEAKAWTDCVEYCRKERRDICGSSPEDIVGMPYKTGRHDGMGTLMAHCEAKAREAEKRAGGGS